MQSFKSWPLDCVGLPDAYHFRSAVSMNVARERNAFFAFGGYEESGNQLFVLNNIGGIESEDWIEEWESRMAIYTFMISLMLLLTCRYYSNGGPSGAHVLSD
jgi:hypothetical protein